MAIVIKAAKVTYDLRTNKVILEYAPFDDVENAFKSPVGYSRKIEVEASELTQDTKVELETLGVDNEP
jgi:hypothetical protein